MRSTESNSGYLCFRFACSLFLFIYIVVGRVPEQKLTCRDFVILPDKVNEIVNIHLFITFAFAKENIFYLAFVFLVCLLAVSHKSY